jgi:hypothetical protein
MSYTDVEFEDEFVILPAHEPSVGWVIVDAEEIRELEEEHAQRIRSKAIQKKFHTELIKISSITGKSVADLSAKWADHIVQQVKCSGRKVSDVATQLRERIVVAIEKKTELELNPNAYRDVGLRPLTVEDPLEPCFPPAR